MSNLIQIDDLYDVEAWLEDGGEAGGGLGFAGFLSDQGFSVFTRLNSVEDFQKVRPRLELRAVLGGHNGHKALCQDGNERNDQWAFTLAVQVVTVPEPKAEDNVLHGKMRAKLRMVMSTAAQLTWNDTEHFPYHAVAEAFLETGTVPVLREDDGLEYSTISFGAVVAVRSIPNVGTAFNLAL